MYICICNPTTDTQIKEYSKTNCSLEELKEQLDICNNCKCCENEVNKIYLEYSK